MLRYKKIKVPKKYKKRLYNGRDYGKKCKGFTRDEHRFVMEKHLGRKLSFNEVVDHVNGNIKDNRLKNLRVMLRSEHTKMHYDQGDYKNMFSKEALSKKKKYDVARRLPHTKDKFTCVLCRKLKHKSLFFRNKNRWNGLSNTCKKCIYKIQNR